MTVRRLPKWFIDEYSENNLRGIRDELKILQIWADGYTAAGGKIPSTDLLGGPRRGITLLNKLLDSYK